MVLFRYLISRISLLNLWDVALRMLGKKKNAPKTYATRFLYPLKGGIGRMCDKMAERITENGGRVIVDARVTRINTKDGAVTEVVYERDGREEIITADKFISTIPLPGFVKVKPMVFAGIYPAVAEDYTQLREAL